MPTFVYDRERGHMVDKATGAPMNPEPLSGPFPTPQVIGDIAPYQSPVTGEVISGKRAKRDDLARHGCVDAAELPSATGGKFRNKKFAEKWGVTARLAEDAR
jgi:hypothetical protein